MSKALVHPPVQPGQSEYRAVKVSIDMDAQRAVHRTLLCLCVGGWYPYNPAGGFSVFDHADAFTRTSRHAAEQQTGRKGAGGNPCFACDNLFAHRALMGTSALRSSPLISLRSIIPDRSDRFFCCSVPKLRQDGVLCRIVLREDQRSVCTGAGGHDFIFPSYLTEWLLVSKQ